MVAINGSSTGYDILNPNGILIINLEQCCDFEAIKLGVHNGNNRIYEDVEVSISADGNDYKYAVIKAVQNFNTYNL